MSALPLVALCLAASPLTVRVLEKERPRSVRVEAAALRCDDAPLPGPATLDWSRDGVKAGERTCQLVRADQATVRVGELARAFPGTLRVSVEDTVLRLVNEVDVEDYLPAVVTAELDAAGPAALEAQAIVSRTFALGSRGRHAATGTDLCDLSHCQVYRGRDTSKEARAAVETTRGKVLLVGGVSLEATQFHAACGGHTSAPADVFREKSAAPGVPDLLDGAPACQAAPDFAWTWTVEKAELAKAVGATAEGMAFESLTRDAAGRVTELRSFGRRLRGPEFASLVGRVFGWQTLRSLKVSAEEADGQVRFRGTGLGHGVGLCQHGAKALAAKGLGAAAILQRYFPQSRVRALDAAP